ncbi:uncharacterized protein [Dermacentor andersoni]|uniref:uncharacterized protein n=1 Tax=Dermacentor andersoni TaxID=34620 RepID=UPI0024160100|nr:uncharacterized protein LOC129381362 [Dermacentor andersoni]
MARKETARPYFTMSGGSCVVKQGTSSTAIILDFGRDPEGTWELHLGQHGNQAANTTLVCFQCGIAFACKEAFHKHMTIHMTGIPGETWAAARYQNWNQLHNRTIVCHLCGAAFTDMDTFQRHNAGHENGETFPAHGS